MPSICAEDQIADWFASLDECLRWNDRKRQRHLDDVGLVDDLGTTSSDDSPTTSGPLLPEKDIDAGGLQSVLEKLEPTDEGDEEQ